MIKKILDNFKKTNMPLYNFLLNKWYIDEIYDYLFVNPLKKLVDFFGRKETSELLIDLVQMVYQE